MLSSQNRHPSLIFFLARTLKHWTSCGGTLTSASKHDHQSASFYGSGGVEVSLRHVATFPRKMLPLVGLHVEGVGVTTEFKILEMEGRKERERVKERVCGCVCVREIINKEISGLQRVEFIP